MKRVFALLSTKDIWTLVIRLVAVNAAFSLIILILDLFLDIESLRSQFPFVDTLGLQTTFILFFLLIEVIIVATIVVQWVYTRRPLDASAPKIPLDEALRQAEGEHLEFKSSARWDYKKGQVNKELEYVVARSISGFMNAKGGTIVIGVDDAKQVIGLETDYKTLKKQSGDGFLLNLSTIINNYLGKEYARFVSSRIESVEGKDVCVVDIEPSLMPAYVKHDNTEEFYIRSMASTQPLNAREAHEYIEQRWKKK